MLFLRHFCQRLCVFFLPREYRKLPTKKEREILFDGYLLYIFVNDVLISYLMRFNFCVWFECTNAKGWQGTTQRKINLSDKKNSIDSFRFSFFITSSNAGRRKKQTKTLYWFRFRFLIYLSFMLAELSRTNFLFAFLSSIIANEMEYSIDFAWVK